MKHIGGNEYGCLWSGARLEPLFENRRLIPRDRMQRQVGDPGPLRRKWKLPHHRQHMWQHIFDVKAREPEAQIEGIGHMLTATVNCGCTLIVNVCGGYEATRAPYAFGEY